MTDPIATRAQITSLKKRRDVLLNTAATLKERNRIHQAVKRINREIRSLNQVAGLNDSSQSGGK